MRNILVISLFLISGIYAQRYISLDGNDWVVENSNQSISVPASVPGNVFLDLHTNGIIDEPIYRFTERACRWIALESEWIFRKTFTIPSDFANGSNIFLQFQGIDTISSIYLNHKLIGWTDNMFRSWSFRLNDTTVHRYECNHLEVRIRSAIRYAQEMAARTPYVLPSSDWLQFSFPHRNMIRKSQSDFGWDWGPAFAGCGIYKSVGIVIENEAFVSQCYMDQLHHPNGTVEVDVTAVVKTATSDDPYQMSLEVSFDNRKDVRQFELIENHGQQVLGAKFQYFLPTPKLWWPQGYGTQHLYSLTCKVVGQRAPPLTKRIGVRKVNLIREPISGDHPGETFFFRVNGADIFIKGANLIPLHSFPANVSTADLRKMLQNAVDANMNMIRVWGGGLYQPNEFYDLADEFGILIWQELMFACATYPRDLHFLQNVAIEVEEQIQRLRDHPSIAVIGGNNENEASMTWFNETRQNPALYFVDYAKLFIDVIREKVLQIAPNLDFVISSPSNGHLSEDPFVLRWGDTNSNLFGDVHFYNYEHDCSDPDLYPDARFISEFGFQSLPSLSTLSSVAAEVDLLWDSEWMRYRQRHENGNRQLWDQIQRQFHVSNATSFRHLIFLSQASQSICYRTAIEKWRRGRSKFKTMGVLYWQLNSIWPAPTWSSIEATTLRWKMLHYHIRDLFEPVLISMLKTGNSIDIYILTDSVVESKVELVVDTWSASGAQLKNYVVQLNLKPQSDSVAMQIPLEEPTPDIVHAAILCNGEYLHQNVFMLRKFKDLQLQNPRVTITAMSLVNAQMIEIRLICSSLSAFVFFESLLPGRFSFNAPFLLFPDKEYTVKFWSDGAIDLDQFASNFMISSLYDTLPTSVITSNLEQLVAYR